MTIPVSTISAVKGYVYDGLLARPELAAPVLVSYDDPGPNLPEDIVAVCDAQGALGVMQMVGGSGAGWMDEKYVLQVIVDVYRGGVDARLPFERCATLAAVVLDFLRTDSTCGGVVNIQAAPGRFQYESAWEPERQGRLVRCTVEFDVHARL